MLKDTWIVRVRLWIIYPIFHEIREKLFTRNAKLDELRGVDEDGVHDWRSEVGDIQTELGKDAH